MKYLVIADHVAHGAADLLDLATHPEATKMKIKPIVDALRNAVSIEDHLTNNQEKK